MIPMLPRSRFLSAFCVLAALNLAAPAAHAAPLSLDEAIRLALTKNQTIKVQSFGRDIARANLLAAAGTFDPSLNFRRTYSENGSPVSSNPLVKQLTQTDDYSLTLDGIMPWGLSYSLGGSAQNQRGTYNGFRDTYSTFGGVTITQPLLRGFGFGANLYTVRVAKADRSISDWDYRQIVIDTVTSVIFSYNNLEQARQNLRITTLSRNLAAQLLAENEKRFQVGSLSAADVTQARARVANREESILLAERAVQDVENQLRQLVGETDFTTITPALELEPLAPAAELIPQPAEDLKKAYDVRPDYQAALLGLVKRRAGDSLARNQLLPRVDAVGSYGYNGLDSDFAASRRQVGNEDNRAYSAGVVVSVPLTFAAGRGKARAARLGLRQAEADLTRLEQDIAVSVANAAGQLETTRRRVAATRTAYELAKQALEAEVKRLRAGTSSTFVVLQLQENLADVEIRQVRALADQRRATANYERELGTTLTRQAITLQ
jgi:outer membrane protein